MKIMKKLMALVLASALALTLLTGCGGGGGSSSSNVVVNGRPMSIDKTRIDDFETAFAKEMKQYGYDGVTYNTTATNLLDESLKEAAKTQAIEAYTIAGAAYIGNPDWNDIAGVVAGELQEWAYENGVTYSNQVYGYVRVTDTKTGAQEIAVLIFGQRAKSVV